MNSWQNYISCTFVNKLMAIDCYKMTLKYQPVTLLTVTKDSLILHVYHITDLPPTPCLSVSFYIFN